MIKFLHLLEFELKRFFPYGAALMVGILFLQIIFYAQKIQHMSVIASQSSGPPDFTLWGNGLVYYEVLPIMVGMTIIGAYTFIIWYRDWRGRSPIIYRLLMLPNGRIRIFWSKALTIIMYTFCLVFTQLLTLWVIYQMYQQMMPSGWLLPYSFQGFVDLYPFSILLPNNPVLFVALYGLGTALMILIFTCILLERSLHWKGLINGVAWFIFNIILCLLPYMLLTEKFTILLSYEAAILSIMIVLGLTGLNLFISNYLLKNKIAV